MDLYSSTTLNSPDSPGEKRNYSWINFPVEGYTFQSFSDDVYSCFLCFKQVSQAREKIFINKNDCASLTLYVILEPYTRKYGIEIIYDENLDSAENHEVDSIASPLTLDREVEKVINQMFQGEKSSLPV